MKTLLFALGMSLGLLIATPAITQKVSPSSSFTAGTVGPVIFLCSTLNGVETIREITEKREGVSEAEQNITVTTGLQRLINSNECGRLPGLMPFRLIKAHFAFVDWQGDYIVAWEGVMDNSQDKRHYFSPLVDNDAHPKNEI